MTSNELAAELILKCFHLRTVAHIQHLRTTSYEEHKALNELYDEVIPLVDSFAEVYQGDFGLLEIDYLPATKIPVNSLEMMNQLTDWIVMHRSDIGDADSTHIQNILDEILALFSTVRYKLRFLK